MKSNRNYTPKHVKNKNDNFKKLNHEITLTPTLN